MDYLLELIKDIENSMPVPMRYIAELAEYPGMSQRLKDIDWSEGDIRIKADILALVREYARQNP